MELFLNSAWALLAIASACLWKRLEHRTGAERRSPLIALALLIVILFPVISVSDDLQALQNPAESDTFQCQRRDCLASCPHSIHPAIAALPEPVFAEAAWSFQRNETGLNSSSRAVENPAFDAIQNRPPPAA
jgi:nitrate reductase NapE component